MSIRLRRTKIITTLGPATDLDNNLEKVIYSGANVVRLNFSHGTENDHIIRAKKVREISSKLGRYVAIIGDLQGPKIRISTFKKSKIILNVGDKFILDALLSPGMGNNKQVGIDYKKLPMEVIKGDILLLDDGRIHLKVIKINNMRIYTKVIVGGNLSNNKGINKLGGGLSAKSLTPKDKKDIITAAKIGVDYIAISFVRTVEELHYARSLMQSTGSKAKIISKIERAELIYNEEILNNIIIASDVVMVARGDLGVEIGVSELVGIQKKIISISRKLNRAVITATQMMESMINNPIPTRAEVLDVANAVLDGTDAVMLSAETAIGKYPVETVKIMSNVCLGAEKLIKISKHRINIQFNSIEETIAMSAMYAANHLKGIKAIISITETGNTALLMSRISSCLPIFAISQNKNTLNLTALYRGVNPFNFKVNTRIISASYVTNLLKKNGFLFSGDLVIITKSNLINVESMTNTVIIFKVE